MKRYFLSLFAFLFLILAVRCAAGEDAGPPRQIWMTISVLSLPSDCSGAFEEAVRAGKAVELQTVHFPVRSDRDAQLLIGEKHPLLYYDEKTSSSHVVYVDIGMMFNLRALIKPGSTLDLEFYYALSDVEDYRRAVERDTVTYFPSSRSSEVRMSARGLKDGETVVLADMSGASIGGILKSLAKKRSLSEGSRLVVAATPQLAPAHVSIGDPKGLPAPSSVEFEILSVPGAIAGKYAHQGILSDDDFAAVSGSEGAHRIDSHRILTSDRDASVHVGRKYPMTYFTPRSGGSQVTYIDIGLRCDARCTPVDKERWVADVRFQLSNAEASALFADRRDQVHPVIYSISATTTMELGRGETGILAALGGEFSRGILKDSLFPGVPFAPGEKLLFTLTPR
jgi:hypothetical protein